MKFVVKPPPKILQAKMRRAQRKMGDLTPVNKRVAVFLDRWVQRNFRSQGASVGGWKPFKAGGRWVSKRTHAAGDFPQSGPRRGSGRRTGTRYLDTSAKLLQDTGRLRASFSPFWSRNNAGIGSDLPYSKKHEEGDPAKNLPARRMLPEEREVASDISRIYDDHVANVIREANRR